MKKTPLPLLLLSVLCAAGCGRSETPVAQVEMMPKSVVLPFPELQTVHLSWQPGAALGVAAKPTVFVHLRDAEGKVVRTFDHPFPAEWREGTPVEYDLKLYQSALAPPLKGGKYTLVLGLAGEGKKRWALDGLGEPVARLEYLAAEVEVPPPPAKKKSGPRFTFSEQWMPPEPGADLQLLARRWLSGTSAGTGGGLRMAGLRQRGRIWLVLRIPAPEVAGNLAIQGDGNQPMVRIEGSCGDYEATISGPGTHEVEMPVLDPPKNGMCRMEMVPNFQFGNPPRSVSLENAAWAPAASQPAKAP